MKNLKTLFISIPVLSLTLTSTFCAYTPSVNAGLTPQQILNIGKIVRKNKLVGKAATSALTGAVGAASGFAVKHVLQSYVQHPNGQRYRVCTALYQQQYYPYNYYYSSPFYC